MLGDAALEVSLADAFDVEDGLAEAGQAFGNAYTGTSFWMKMTMCFQIKGFASIQMLSIKNMFVFYFSQIFISNLRKRINKSVYMTCVWRQHTTRTLKICKTYK